LQDGELVAQGKVLHGEGALRLKNRDQGADHGEKHVGKPTEGSP
jgi:hypothetical protein